MQTSSKHFSDEQQNQCSHLCSRWCPELWRQLSAHGSAVTAARMTSPGRCACPFESSPSLSRRCFIDVFFSFFTHDASNPSPMFRRTRKTELLAALPYSFISSSGHLVATSGSCRNRSSAKRSVPGTSQPCSAARSATCTVHKFICRVFAEMNMQRLSYDGEQPCFKKGG